jgi:O-succinylbenzoate synthase
VKVEGVELIRASLPLRTPFETSFGVQTVREVVLLRAVTPEAEGWGECVAMPSPIYSEEFNDAVWTVLRDRLIPAVCATPRITGARVAGVLEPFKGQRMAKAAVEMALLDAELRAAGMRFADYLGAQRDAVPAGVSVGIQPSVPELLDVVAGYLNDGYVRIKLKIKPGWDLEPVRAVRDRFGSELLLQVDANTAYTLADAGRLARLDEFDLLLIEQPLADDDLTQHAALSRLIRTPVCLDESIVSAKAAADAIALGACAVVNIKAGRVGGYLEARRVHDVCRASGIPVWCGGMLETGLGRAANAALAALPGFVLPGDVSASDRFYAQDITAPFALRDGQLDVPTGPGLGVDVRGDVLAERVTCREWIAP